MKFVEKQTTTANIRKVRLIQNNIRLYAAKMTLVKTAKLKWKIILHPYSPDFFSTDFHFFYSLDNHMKNRTSNIEDYLKTHTFFRAFSKMLNRWKKVIGCEGSYIVNKYTYYFIVL